MSVSWILITTKTPWLPLLAELDAETGAGASAFGGAWTILLAYVIGASPFGFIAGRLRGIDIRDHGSGNIGATNVLRVLGKPIGITVFILDVLKGMVPVWIAQMAAGPDQSLVPILAAIAAILGHNYTFWLGFKGGKGIATSAGAILLLIPVPLAIAMVLWFLAFGITRYVSVASIIAGVSLPVSMIVMNVMTGGPWDLPKVVFASFLAAMATWRHKTNLRRLREGTENKFVPGKKREPSPPPHDDHKSSETSPSKPPTES